MLWILKKVPIAIAALALPVTLAYADAQADLRAIAALDTAYQAAVERNDAAAMDAILHQDMVVVLGDGTVLTRTYLLEAARKGSIDYERQVEDAGTQTVRLFGPDSAVVTARLWLKGVRKDGTSVNVRMWFSDTYVRTEQGWRYAFGQASRAEPVEK